MRVLRTRIGIGGSRKALPPGSQTEADHALPEHVQVSSAPTCQPAQAHREKNTRGSEMTMATTEYWFMYIREPETFYLPGITFSCPHNDFQHRKFSSRLLMWLEVVRND